MYEDELIPHFERCGHIWDLRFLKQKHLLSCVVVCVLINVLPQVDDGPNVWVEPRLRVHHLHHQGGGVRGCQTGAALWFDVNFKKPGLSHLVKWTMIRVWCNGVQMIPCLHMTVTIIIFCTVNFCDWCVAWIPTLVVFVCCFLYFAGPWASKVTLVWPKIP